MITEVLRSITANVRLTDFIDMVLAAGFIYGFIHWLRSTSSPRVAWTIVLSAILLAALHAISNRLEMVLLESLIVVSLLLVGLGTAVFFQKDIQRTLDRLLLLRFRGPSTKSYLPHSPVGILCEVAGVLAANRQGALIAVRGKQSWSRHTEGGTRLEGIVSVPLLLSIFHPASAGHDGAVLLEGEVVTLFGAHLPLSIAGPLKGTRHAAGLGLSEHVDAFVIIVSEERGTISVARNGKLREVAGPDDLRRMLAPFWEDHYTALVPILSRWRRLRPVTTMLLSLLLAFLLWVVLSH